MRCILFGVKLVIVWVVGCGFFLCLPVRQMALQVPVAYEEAGARQSYPAGVYGLAARGKQVYVAEGCQACHTQFVRGSVSSDSKRGWASRRTVARDYSSEKGVPLGWFRIGADFSNVGSSSWRNEVAGEPPWQERGGAVWIYTSLLSSSKVSGWGSLGPMPSYRYLFREVSAADASDVSREIEKRLGLGVFYEPTDQAKALALYLLSLRRDHPLPEAGPPEVK
jgi:cytochrome c oxidase cbb3-type subunit 2